MNPKAQELYETWWGSLYDQGVAADDWKDLDDYEKQAWSELADELEKRGWQGA